VVWSDGTKVDRRIINLTDTTPFGTKNFRIALDTTGKKWIRFAMWDSAGAALGFNLAHYKVNKNY
jgi:hypothetical protein